MSETLELDLTEEEIRLIAYWRESCHNYNSYCPLKSLPKGTAFCHGLCDKIAATIEKDLEEEKSKK